MLSVSCYRYVHFVQSIRNEAQCDMRSKDNIHVCAACDLTKTVNQRYVVINIVEEAIFGTAIA